MNSDEEDDEQDERYEEKELESDENGEMKENIQFDRIWAWLDGWTQLRLRDEILFMGYQTLTDYELFYISFCVQIYLEKN